MHAGLETIVALMNSAPRRRIECSFRCSDRIHAGGDACIDGNLKDDFDNLIARYTGV